MEQFNLLLGKYLRIARREDLLPRTCLREAKP
jgi:hypothetical protein